MKIFSQKTPHKDGREDFTKVASNNIFPPLSTYEEDFTMQHHKLPATSLSESSEQNTALGSRNDTRWCHMLKTEKRQLRVYLCRRQYHEEDFTMQYHEFASNNIFPPQKFATLY